MNYEDFKKEMARLLTKSFEYKPNQIGSKEFVSKMADLADEYPEFDERLENEHQVNIGH